MKIAVAAATGRVGRHVVDVLHEFVGQLMDWGRQGRRRLLTEDAHAAGRRQDGRRGARRHGHRRGAGAGSGRAVPEIAGPREESLVEIATLLAARRGDPVRIEGVSDASDPDRELIENGGLLPGPHAKLAGPTFEQWLGAGQ
jgi:hypothetical protein